jgi:hypothetical protein
MSELHAVIDFNDRAGRSTFKQANTELTKATRFRFTLTGPQYWQSRLLIPNRS